MLFVCSGFWYIHAHITSTSPVVHMKMSTHSYVCGTGTHIYIDIYLISFNGYNHLIHCRITMFLRKTSFSCAWYLPLMVSPKAFSVSLSRYIRPFFSFSPLLLYSLHVPLAADSYFFKCLCLFLLYLFFVSPFLSFHFFFCAQVYMPSRTHFPKWRSSRLQLIEPLTIASS